MSDDKPVDLDEHRGIAAQKSTLIRRRSKAVREDHDEMQVRRDAFEEKAIAAAARSWLEVADRARYLIELFATTEEARDPRRKALIAQVLEDFDRLGAPGKAPK